MLGLTLRHDGLELWRGDYNAVFAESPSWFFVYPLGTFIAVPLIAYGILRTQLFDIDLRIRWTIRQATLVAAVVALVHVVSEGAGQLSSHELGNVAGLLAAAIIVFFLATLQRFAERVRKRQCRTRTTRWSTPHFANSRSTRPPLPTRCRAASAKSNAHCSAACRSRWESPRPMLRRSRRNCDKTSRRRPQVQ